MEEFKATKAIKGVPTTELETTDMWNGFWTAAAKMQKRKRKKSLTVSEKKKREAVKARKTVLKRMATEITKPVTHLLNDPIVYEYND